MSVTNLRLAASAASLSLSFVASHSLRSAFSLDKPDGLGGRGWYDNVFVKTDRNLSRAIWLSCDFLNPGRVFDYGPFPA